MSAAMQKFPLIPKQLLQGKVWVQKRLSSIHSKPPKGKVGPAETVIGLTVFAMGLLTPAGYILMHVREYRKR